MPATRRSPDVEITPEQRHDEIISILAVGLARLVGASPPRVAPAAVPASMPANPPASMPADTPASMHAENLSESAEIGLELPGETRLSVPAG
jgi:hypothetical protein